MEKTKESYIDYLVNKVSEGVNKILDERLEEIKSTFINMDYKMSIEKTEEILKKYRKLKQHIELTKFSDKELKDEANESYNKEIEQMMTEIFSESESYLKSLLRSRYKTKSFILFIEKVLNYYLSLENIDDTDIRKKRILKEIYINGVQQTDYIYDNYDSERTFYRDKARLIKDLAPYFFGIKGIEI